MQAEYIIGIAVPLVTGLIILIYKHPIAGRKLLTVISIVTTGMFALWGTFSIGAHSEYARLSDEVRGKEITLSRRDDTTDILIFGLGSVATYLILLALSHFFEDLHKKKVDKVKD